jgi:hypothetical protein
MHPAWGIAHVVTALAFVASCGSAAPRAVSAASAGSSLGPTRAGATAASASAGPSAEAAARWPPTLAERWTWDAIACWVGPPWAEAQGSVGVERALASDRRCRLVAHEALGVAENDAASLRAMGDVEPNLAARIADAIAAKVPDGDRGPALLRAAAPACREAWAARRAAERLRRPMGASIGTPDALGEPDALVAYGALAHLATLDLGDRTGAARLLVLVLAADRLETARDLQAGSRLRAMAPALGIVFGVGSPARAPGAGAAGEEPFVELLSAAALRGGHAPTFAAGSSVRARESEAFASVVAAVADRFDGLTEALGSDEGARVARGYALRLHQALDARRARPSSSSSARP